MASSRVTLGSIALAVLAICSPAAPSLAAVNAIGPFVGEFRDNFNQYTQVMAELDLPVFGGRAEIHMLDLDGAIKVEFNSTFNGDQVLAIEPWMVGQLGIVDWTFDQPAYRFGGYWENNSGASHATLQFFDANGALIGTHVANVPVNAQSWTWNGWKSDVPFARIRSTGNGIVNGFIWYENMELSVTPIPEPASSGLAIALISVAGAARARRRRQQG